MIKFATLIFIIAAGISCVSVRYDNQDKKTFANSKTLRSFTAIADMNDAHFILKENNYFEFYRKLFDSVKNSVYPGKFTQIGDTLYLDFFKKEGKDVLGSKAVLKKDDIIFFK